VEYSVEFRNVWKRFKRGEKATLLRDAIPSLVGKLIKQEKSVSDKQFWALKDVSFTVEKGRVLGIIGRNGAGKTTVLKLLSGVMEPTRGNVIIRGRLACLIAAGAGFHPEFTGRENVYLCGSIMGMKRKEIIRQFDAIVEFASYGLSDFKKFIDTPIKRYSAGMYVRLGFAIAAHIKPDVLLIDEVLAVGDGTFQRKCFEYIDKLKKSDATIIIVSHNMHHIVNYCDRALLFGDGKIVADSSPADVIEMSEFSLPQ
jgi:lipopolysaccharide transport system ATP-binding protein